MADNLQHVLAASCYVMDATKAISSGRLPEDLEMLLRESVARTRTAFRFDLPRNKSNDNTSLDDVDRTIAAVAIEVQDDDIGASA